MYLVFALGVSVLLWCADTTAQSSPESDLGKIKEKLEQMLLENIVPFWYPQVIDRDDGGYRLNHDQEGRWLGPANKTLVTQSRTVWFFSELCNAGYGTEEHLEAARHGFAFLRDRMWDHEFGGFFWEVDAQGKIATRPHKHLYSQGFALYALAAYIQATGDTSAVRLAREFFRLLEFHAHDGEYGGYREFFRRDWGPVPENIDPYMGGDGPKIKLMNTHLHLMEPFTTYYLVSRDPVVRERLVELIFVQSNAVVRKEVGGCTDKYERDWTPLRDPQYERISYGHDIENVWLLVEACSAAGIANGPLLDLYRTLMDYSLRYGFDHEEGGFYDTGPFGEPADQRDKIWWVQAEGLVASLYMYYLTREERYFTAFAKTLDWISEHQVDWERGDWHAWIADGEAGGSKAGAWKSPYHNGRAMLQCLKIIDSLEAEGR